MDNDLISRSELKNAIIEPLNVNDVCKNDWYEGYYTAKNEDVMTIDNAPTVEINTNDIEYKAYCKGLEDGKKIARQTGEWIPVSERLPEEHEWIGTKEFGTTISDEVHITFDVNGKRFVKTLSLQNGKLSNYDKQFMDSFYIGWKMVAWQPLPEPYKEGGAE